jgi:hypothetical protein
MTTEYVRPDADTTRGGWTDQASGTTTIYATLDETSASDLDYVQSPGISATQSDLKVRLYQGASQVVEWTHTDIGYAFTDAAQTLTSPQLAAISDFSNLFIELDDNTGNVYRFTLGDPVGAALGDPVVVRYRFKKLLLAAGAGTASGVGAASGVGSTAGGAAATFAFVSGTNVSTNMDSPTSSAVNTTGVDLLIMSVGYYNPAQDSTLPAVSDSKGNTWTPLTVHNTGTNAANVLFYSKNPTVGSGHTFTISSNYSSISVAGFSGSDTTAPFDQQNGAGTTSSTSLATGSITPSAANELIIAGGGTGGGGTTLVSIATGFTVAQTDNGGSQSFPSALGYKIQTTATAENATFSISFSNQIAVTIASFKTL